MLVRRQQRWPNSKHTLVQRCVIAECVCGCERNIPASTIRWPYVDSMLVNRLRRWPNIGSTWGQLIVPAETCLN